MTIMTGLTPNTMTLLMSEDGVVTGNEIVITALDGLESTSMRRASTARLMADGDFTEKGTKGGKVVTVEGDAVFDTRREAKEFVMDLLSFLADGGVGRIVVIDEDLELIRSTYVELNNLDEPIINGTSVSFAYDLYAADPAKYGEPVDFVEDELTPGIVTASNAGTADAAQVFIVTGDYPEGVAILNLSTGEQVAVSGSVTATDVAPLVIDSRTGRASLGTASVTTRLTYREWSVIKGKSSEQYQLSYPSAGTAPQTLKVRVQPKWH